LTLEQFEKVLLLCIIHYNCNRVIELPYGIDGIGSHAKDLWNCCLTKNKDMLIPVNKNLLNLTLLPRCRCFFKRNGLWANGLRYRAIGFTDEYLKSNMGWAAYDPKNVNHVWYELSGQYFEFDLIESFFLDKSLEEVRAYKNKEKDEAVHIKELESEIRLSNEIEKIGNVSNRVIEIKNVRKNRKKEIIKK